MPFDANLFWQHPTGDTTTTPCIHLVPLHPNGDPLPNLPCTHIVQQHPNGHPLPNVPCTHIVQQHPNGDPNPLGFGPNIPCVHLVQQHPNGHPNPLPNAPCTHFVQQHPNGHPIPNAPCVHIVQQHPNGDPGPVIPCLHPMNMLREDTNLHIKFYTNNATIQNETIAAAQRLKDLGISIGTAIRPLCVFNRSAVNGNPNDNTDPFWSHYNPLFHSIQITRRPGALDLVRLRDTLHHEMGHATIGQSLIQIGGGGPHQIDTESNPDVAMSEGWAHFIALVIRFSNRATNPTYNGMNWGVRDSTVPCSPNVEYNVGCMLWDLLDVRGDGFDAQGRQNDGVIISLAEMFKVYSVTLETIFNTPVLANVGDYLSRLENNNPTLKERIERVRLLNCC